MDWWGSKHQDLYDEAKKLVIPSISNNKELAYVIFRTFKKLVTEKYGRDEWNDLINKPI
jgi:hypothetical protein